MGIYGHYYHLPASELRKMLDDPVRADHYFGWDIDYQKPDWLVQFNAKQANVERLGSFINIERTWHAVHFLLTGDADLHLPITSTLGKVVLGGNDTEWEDSISTGRYMMPNEVVEVVAALEDITDAELRARYQPAEFKRKKIYPGGNWDATDLSGGA